MRFWPKRRKTPLDLTPYAGEWVAVKGRRVIAHAPTAHAIMADLETIGADARGSTLVYQDRAARAGGGE